MLLSVTNLTQKLGDRTVFQNINFELLKGEVLFVLGPSGVGKSVLLRALACLDPFEAGVLLLDGKGPEQLSYPAWRTRICYVLQSRVTHKGSPAETFEYIKGFAVHKDNKQQLSDVVIVFEALGLGEEQLHQPWSELSGGQAQRAALGVAVALKPDFLLLDEPTSACDPDSVRKVEEALKSCGAGLIWVSHDPEQPGRIGGRALHLPSGELGLVEA